MPHDEDDDDDDDKGVGQYFCHVIKIFIAPF